MKVHDLACIIGVLEGLDKTTLDILETAAIVHDIGIHPSERKYGMAHGRLQEAEGPAEARLLLKRGGEWTDGEVERVCFLVSRHHTYKGIDSMDWQILVEADLLVNIYEDNMSLEGGRNVLETVFRTRTGRLLWDALYGGEPWEAALERIKGC